jgi:hypothetical protein
LQFQKCFYFQKKDKNKCPKIDFFEMMLEKRKMCVLYNKLPKLLKEKKEMIIPVSRSHIWYNM